MRPFDDDSHCKRVAHIFADVRNDRNRGLQINLDQLIFDLQMHATDQKARKPESKREKGNSTTRAIAAIATCATTGSRRAGSCTRT